MHGALSTRPSIHLGYTLILNIIYFSFVYQVTMATVSDVSMAMGNKGNYVAVAFRVVNVITEGHHNK